MRTSDSEPSSGQRERVRSLIESAPFERGVTVLIAANAVTLGVEASPPISAGLTEALHAFDRAVLAVFAVELLLRLFVYRGRFWRDPWRVFDAVVVWASP